MDLTVTRSHISFVSRSIPLNTLKNTQKQSYIRTLDWRFLKLYDLSRQVQLNKPRTRILRTEHIKQYSSRMLNMKNNLIIRTIASIKTNHDNFHHELCHFVIIVLIIVFCCLQFHSIDIQSKIQKCRSRYRWSRYELLSFRYLDELLSFR